MQQFAALHSGERVRMMVCMRLLVAVWVVALFGCPSAPVPLADAGVDKPSACADYTIDESGRAPIGECCVEARTPACASGFGLCVVDVCVRQCSGTRAECPGGTTKTWRETQYGEECLCVY